MEGEEEIPCTDNMDCGDFATCGVFGVGHTGTICKCDERRATPLSYNTTRDAAEICSKERKDKTTAIILTVIFGEVGAGSFYMGWTLWAIIPFMLCIGVCLCGCLSACAKKSEKSVACGVLTGCMTLLSSCACSGLVIATLIFVSGSQCVSREGIACV